MTTDVIVGRSNVGLNLRAVTIGRAFPLATVLLIIGILWYLAAIWLNAPLARMQLDRNGAPWTVGDLVLSTWSMDRPILPTPDQVIAEFWKSTVGSESAGKRNLLYHAWVTGSAAIIGFVIGTLLGIALAVGVVHVRTLDRSLMPWIIVSQTIPILAIAPMMILVLNAVGFPVLLAKAAISAYLSFFPVTIGMVKGLRSPDPLQLDLMHTYSANDEQLFWKLRWPASIPFLFASLKVSIAISLVGAIVGELPTGATAGLGAWLLIGYYHGLIFKLWATLLMASLLGMVLVLLVGAAERIVVARMGARPA